MGRARSHARGVISAATFRPIQLRPARHRRRAQPDQAPPGRAAGPACPARLRRADRFWRRLERAAPAARLDAADHRRGSGRPVRRHGRPVHPRIPGHLTPASRVIAVDRIAARLDLARELGATDVINVNDVDLNVPLPDLTQSGGFYGVVEQPAAQPGPRRGYDPRASRSGGYVVGAPAFGSQSAWTIKHYASRPPRHGARHSRQQRPKFDDINAAVSHIASARPSSLFCSSTSVLRRSRVQHHHRTRHTPSPSTVSRTRQPDAPAGREAP